MRFDAKALVAAFEPPTFVDLDGEVYVGRHLSHVEHSRFLDRFQDWAKEAPPREEVDKLVLEMCTACNLQGARIVALPEPVYAQWVDSFFGYLAAPGTNGQSPAPASSISATP